RIVPAEPAQLVGRQPDHDFVLDGDDLEQRDAALVLAPHRLGSRHGQNRERAAGERPPPREVAHHVVSAGVDPNWSRETPDGFTAAGENGAMARGQCAAGWGAAAGAGGGVIVMSESISCPGRNGCSLAAAATWRSSSAGCSAGRSS